MAMKYKMMKKTGALQEGVPNSPARRSLAPQMNRMSSAASGEFSSYVESHNTAVNLPAIGNPVTGLQSYHAGEDDFRAPLQQQMLSNTNAYALADDSASFDQLMPPPPPDELTGVPPDRSRMLNLRRSHSPGHAHNSNRMSQDPNAGRQPTMGLFTYTVAEGQRVLMTDNKGKGEVLDGPCRVWRWGRRFLPLSQNVAYPGEFLIVRFRDGSQEHHAGPAKIWFDPRKHSELEKEDALQLAAKEAVVVYYRKEDDPDAETHGKVQRRIVMGPEVFIPAPGEWLHTFCWHGTKGSGYQKLPGALVFQKIWLMPDQMYHDVVDVRTADDVVLTVKLMLFFELVNVEKMLDETHDPIGDFINAASSDVLDLVGRYTFDEFKTHTERLNDVASYTQLLNRAEQVGYKINKIVYRGYTTTAALQSMHEQAIEARTRLKLQRETENQSQELSDFKQQREYERATKTREDRRLQEEFELSSERLRHKQSLELEAESADSSLAQEQKENALRLEKQRLEWEIRREQAKLDAEYELAQKVKLQQLEADFLANIKEMGVDLTSYLTQGRADQVIELRGQDEISPHLHIERNR